MQPNPQAGSNNFVAADGTQLDPTAATLTRALRQVESQGNYNAVGKSGEKGAYQWMPGNFEAQAKEAGLNPSDFSPTNQDKVAYYQVNKLLRAGHKQSEIASFWNSGGFDPNGKVGTNKEGANFNTPQYVANVENAYKQILTGGGTAPTQNTSNQDEGINTAFASTGSQEPNQSDGILSKIGGLAAKGANFLFPIAKDLYHDVTGQNDKTVLQQFGDAGISILPFLPGIGEAGEAARAGEGLAEGVRAGSGILKTVKAGAAGYGIGALANLSQGKSIGQSIAPNAGTIGGAITGGLFSKFGDLLDAHFGKLSALKNNAQAFSDMFGATKTGAKAERIANIGNKDIVDFLAHSGIVAKDAVEERNGRLVVNGAEGSPIYQELSNRAHSIVRLGKQAISSLGDEQPEVSMTSLRNEALKIANNADKDQNVVNEIKDAITNKASGYAKKNGGKLALGDIWGLKSDLDELSSKLYKNPFSSATQSSQIKAYKILADVMRKRIETEADNAGLPGIKALNALASTHYAARDALARLDGQTLRGGRLGGYFAGTAGAALGAPIGEAVAASLGGGLIGKVAGTGVGALAGGLAGNSVNKLMQRFASNPYGAASIIGKLAQEDPEVVRQFVDFISQHGGEAPQGLVAPAVKVPQKTQGLFKGLVKRAISRGGQRLPASL